MLILTHYRNLANQIIIALIWLDVGRDLSSCPMAPWVSNTSFPDSCLPVIHHSSKAALRSNIKPRPSSSTESLPDKPHNNSTQSAKLLPFQYGSSLDGITMRGDALYALNELYTSTACSESQFFNFMAEQVAEALRSSERHEELSINNLRFKKKVY